MRTIFTAPIEFSDAMNFLGDKVDMPTSLNSAQLSQIDRKILNQALTSARVNQATIIQRMARVIDAYMRGEVSRTQARESLAQFVDQSGYIAPGPGMADLTTDARMNLILDTNTKMAAGYGQFVTANDPDSLAAWPCQELVRVGARKEPRDWEQRWDDAGGSFYGDRMIAAKDDEVWQELADGAGGYDDTLGNPWPPFAFNSGMGVEPVARDEAVALGVIAEDYEPEAADLEFPDPVAGALNGLLGDIGANLLLGLAA